MNTAEKSSEAESAIVRVKAALERVEKVADTISEIAAEKENAAQAAAPENSGASSAKVTTLVNKHEEVAVTMRELDSIISKLEI
jgi:chemotaxis signal transduction protein